MQLGVKPLRIMRSGSGLILESSCHWTCIFLWDSEYLTSKLWFIWKSLHFCLYNHSNLGQMCPGHGGLDILICGSLKATVCFRVIELAEDYTGKVSSYRQSDLFDVNKYNSLAVSHVGLYDLACKVLCHSTILAKLAMMLVVKSVHVMQGRLSDKCRGVNPVCRIGLAWGYVLS